VVNPLPDIACEVVKVRVSTLAVSSRSGNPDFRFAVRIFSVAGLPIVPVPVFSVRVVLFIVLGARVFSDFPGAEDCTASLAGRIGSQPGYAGDREALVVGVGNPGVLGLRHTSLVGLRIQADPFSVIRMDTLIVDCNLIFGKELGEIIVGDFIGIHAPVGARYPDHPILAFGLDFTTSVVLTNPLDAILSGPTGTALAATPVASAFPAFAIGHTGTDACKTLHLLSLALTATPSTTIGAALRGIALGPADTLTVRVAILVLSTFATNPPTAVVTALLFFTLRLTGATGFAATFGSLRADPALLFPVFSHISAGLQVADVGHPGGRFIDAGREHGHEQGENDIRSDPQVYRHSVFPVLSHGSLPTLPGNSPA